MWYLDYQERLSAFQGAAVHIVLNTGCFSRVARKYRWYI